MAQALVLKKLISTTSQVEADGTLAEGAGATLKTTTSKYVRRPLQGIQPKKDTYAKLILHSATGGELTADASVKNSSSPHSSNQGLTHYTPNFLIQSISESRQEKSQTIPTFGDTFYYFFGEQPVQVQVNAVLLNSSDFEWELEWWENYSNTFRGTKLVDRNRRVVLAYETVTLQGFISTCSVQKDAMNPLHSTLSFTMFVDKKQFGTDKGFPVGHNVLSENLVGNLQANVGSEDVVTVELKTSNFVNTLEALKSARELDEMNPWFEAAGRAGPFLEGVANGISAVKDVLDFTPSDLLSPAGASLVVLSNKELLSVDYSGVVSNTLARAATRNTRPAIWKYPDILGEYVETPIGLEIDVGAFTKELDRALGWEGNISASIAAEVRDIESTLSGYGFEIDSPRSPVSRDNTVTSEQLIEAQFNNVVAQQKESQIQSVKSILTNTALFVADIATLEAKRFGIQSAYSALQGDSSGDGAGFKAAQVLGTLVL